MSGKRKNNCKTITKIAGIIALFVALLILLALAVIPQFFARRALKEMVHETDYALSVVSNKEELMKSITRISDLLHKNTGLLHLIYSHEDVTELELATTTAVNVAKRAFDETGEIINALCRIKTQEDVMLELEKLTIGKII